MGRGWWLPAGMVVGLASGVAWAQAGTAAQPAHRSCSVVHVQPSEADRATQAGKHAEAEALFRKQQEDAGADNEAAWAAATAGIVRSELAMEHVAAALAMARSSATAHPASAVLADVLGEAEMRDGEPEEAVKAYSRALVMDACDARTHFDVSRYYQLAGLRGTARKELDVAHRLSPDDWMISREWKIATAVVLTAEQRIALLRTRLAEPDLTDEERRGLEEAIRAVGVGERGDCTLVGTAETAKLELVPIANGPSQQMYGLGLDVQMNGKRRRLQLDTGASGLLISRSAAASAGLVPEAEVTAGGIGDKGRRASFLTHVDDLRIGGMEFHNCMVRVLEQRNVMEVDGLIGPDVFRNYLVTLDLPSRQMRLAPLPKRPEEPAATEDKTLATTGEGGSGTPAATGTPRPAPRDRYVAPEMKGWTSIYRVGHELIVPTKVGDAPVKLFLLDTGASAPLIAPEVAKEVTHVSSDTGVHVKGISGEVKDVKQADSVTITFAHVRQRLGGIVAVDLSGISRSSGVGIGGLIAFPTLRELQISIDYRDNLMEVVYDPNHGFHGR